MSRTALSTEDAMSTDRTAARVPESLEVLAEIERSTPYGERAFPFRVRQVDRANYLPAVMVADVADEFGDRTWRGTRDEWMEFVTSVGRGCGHEPGPSMCAHFCAWRYDQREWDGLLFA